MMSGRTLFREVVLASALLLAAERAHAQFEGIVESKNATIDETGVTQHFVMTMSIKKDRIRIETSPAGTTPGTVMIYRSDRKVVWMLNEEDKTYFEVLHETRVQGGQPPSMPDPGDKPVVRRTGKSRKILGYSSEQIIVKRYDQETELWATKGLGGLSATISQVLGQDESGSGWMDEVTALGLFPLIASTKIDGKVVESQEITRIEAKSLAEDLFELPSGFRKQAIGEGLEGTSGQRPK